MKLLKKIRNHLCYCGIEKEEYNAVKRGTYASNFEVWRILHCVMCVLFGCLFIYSLFPDIMRSNRIFYLLSFIYSLIVTIVFFILKKESIAAQFLIYLSITMLLLFGCLITQNKPYIPAASFFVLLLVAPMFVINRPFYIMIELIVMSTVFTVWMYFVKPLDIWKMDFINVVIYTIVGIFLHIIANSVRIKEFVLTRKINIQKDTDELTGLNNKGALTRAIDKYLSRSTNDKGIMFMMDINDFKMVNDTYGHDVGDEVINRFGAFLADHFDHNEILGRFGGDEFVIFVKDTDDPEEAGDIARKIIEGASECFELPDKDKKISVSIGVAIYHGKEKHYSELFKRADIALYKAKNDRKLGFTVCR